MASKIMPEIDREICNLCGDCVPACPNGALTMSEDAVVLDQTRCAYCGDCEDICPEAAIALPFDIVLRADPKPEGE